MIRAMKESDLAAVTALLQASAESRGGGLSGEYPAGKVRQMFTSALNTLVDEQDNNIVAVLFSFPPDSAASPVLKTIIQEFGDMLTDAWFYGPVCIDAASRGQGIITALYQQMCSLNPGRPVAFINQGNTRSVTAHIRLGMRKIAAFTQDSVDYFLMAGY